MQHDLKTYANSEEGYQIIRAAIQSLIDKLKQASEILDGPTLDLLGMEIIEKAKRTRGGLFMRVEITEKKLNSTRNKFPGGAINPTVMSHIKNGYQIAVDSYCTAHIPE